MTVRKNRKVTLTDEQLKASKALTKLQRGLVINIVSGMPQRDAYYAAGGKSKTDRTADASISEILANPNVSKFYDSLIESAASDAVMTRQEALERLSLAASVTVADVAEFSHDVIGEDEKGNPIKQTTWRIKNSDEMPAHALSAIKSVTATKFGPKLEMHDPLNAVKQLAEMQGWNSAKKLDLSSSDGTMSPQGKSLDDFYKQTD